MEVDGCHIHNVPVDGGSGVNLMLEDTAHDLEYTTLETTRIVLRMADQSRVAPVGRLSQIPTRIGEEIYLLNYVIIGVGSGRAFKMLLGRPWLYLTRVVVDWGNKEFRVGNPPLRIPWLHSAHEGETEEASGYTSDWSDPDETSSQDTYLVGEFSGLTDEDFKFPDNVHEEGEKIALEEFPADQLKAEDRSPGEACVALSGEWVHQELIDPDKRPVRISRDQTLDWGKLRDEPIEQEPERIKSIVSPKDFEEVEIQPGRKFFMGKTLTPEEKPGYAQLLSEFRDVSAWSPSDLRGIPSKLGEHQIDLIPGATPVRQRQYRLNPKYSLMVKEEIDRLLEAGFIYPVNNSEWVSPIVVVPKKTGADGKVKIRVCQDFRKLNAATKKDYFPLPFTDITLDHVAGQKLYSFLDGFSGYNQVPIRESDQLKTTFTTEWGTYAFNRMPFGLCNAFGGARGTLAEDVPEV